MPEALVYHGPWDLRLEPRARPATPQGREVLIEVRATGICGTDIGILAGAYRARPGVVLGHETAGIVVAVGEAVGAVIPGDRVTIDPTYHCACCRMCRTGRPNHCVHKATREAGVSMDGAFARYYLTEERFAYRIADHVSFEAGSLAEPLSCVLTGLDQLRLRADLETAVVGGGPIGMLYAHALAARGLRGVVIEASDARRPLVERLAPPGWRGAPPSVARRDALDLVVDTSGAGFDWAIATLRRGGQLCVVGLASDAVAVRPADLADRSLSVIGSIDSIGTFGLAVSMIESGAIPTERLVSHRVRLADYREAFALLGFDFEARRRDPSAITAMKVVLAA